MALSALRLLMLLIVAGLFAVAWQLRKIKARIDRVAKQISRRDADSVHDVTHPVFSIQQLHRARRRFKVEYKSDLRLKAELYNSDEWHAQTAGKGAPTATLQARLRTISEATVESESAWKRICAIRIPG